MAVEPGAVEGSKARAWSGEVKYLKFAPTKYENNRYLSFYLSLSSESRPKVDMQYLQYLQKKSSLKEWG